MAENKVEINIVANNRQAVSALGESARAVETVAHKVEIAQVSMRSLATAVVAGQAAFNALSATLSAIPGFAKDSLRVASDFESLGLSLKDVFGSAQAAEDEMKRLREISDRLGVSLQTLAEQYLGFAAAAKGTALEGAKARDVFEAVAEAGTALGLSSEQIAGSLLALQQMMSKGAVSAEEMRQQLGERLYGSLNIAARSIGLTTESFSALMEKGLLPASRLLPAFAEQLRRELGGGAEDASNSARAAFARLENALLDLKLEFARSGFMDAIVEASRQLTGAFRDEEFRKSVREFGALIASLTRFVVEHGDKLVILGGVLSGAGAGAKLGRIAGTHGAAIGAGIGAVAGGAGAYSLLPDGTASGAGARTVRDVEAAVARLQRRIEQTRESSRLGMIKPDEAKARIAADEAMIERLRGTKQPAAQAGGQAGAAFAQELNRKLLDEALKKYATTEEKLADALNEMKDKLRAAGVAEGSKEWNEALAKVRAAMSKGATLTRLPELKKPMDDDIRAMQEALKTQSEIIEAELAGRLIKVADYWKAKEAIDAKAFAAEREKITRELAAQEDLIARLSSVKPKDANQQAEIAQKLNDARVAAANLRSELDALNGKEVAAKFKLDIDREKAMQEIRDAVAEAQAEIARMTGTETPEMRRAAIERAMRDTIEKLKQDAEGAALADRLIDLKAKEAELDAFEKQWSMALDRMRTAEQSANIQAQAGLITIGQAQSMIANAHREAAAAMEDLLPKMEAIANVFGPEAKAKIEQWIAELIGAKTIVDPVANAINTDVKNAFATMFEQIGTGAKNAKEAFLDFARSVIASIQRILAQKLAEKIFGISGDGGGGIGGLISAGLQFLGLGLAFSTGGQVPGTGTGDTVPAMLTPGEYVIRRDVAQRIGYGLLDSINGGFVPRMSMGRLAFASGGLVPSQAQPALPQASQTVRIVNVVDPAMAADYLNSPSGEKTILNILQRNAGTVRQFLA
jgi:tape measure domain-containing protein